MKWQLALYTGLQSSIDRGVSRVIIVHGVAESQKYTTERLSMHNLSQNYNHRTVINCRKVSIDQSFHVIYHSPVLHVGPHGDLCSLPCLRQEAGGEGPGGVFGWPCLFNLLNLERPQILFIVYDTDV